MALKAQQFGACPEKSQSSQCFYTVNEDVVFVIRPILGRAMGAKCAKPCDIARASLALHDASLEVENAGAYMLSVQAQLWNACYSDRYLAQDVPDHPNPASAVLHGRATVDRGGPNAKPQRHSPLYAIVDF
jgi:hypothetical protein